MAKSLLIIGAGGHGKVCAEIAMLMQKWQSIGFLDDHKTGRINNIPIKGKFDLSKFSSEEYELFVAIGDNINRSKIIIDAIEKGFELAKLIHPSAVISQYSEIGISTVIMPMSVINTNSKIGNGVIINTGSVIEHDCIIGDYVHISPNATIAGTCTIGKLTWVGSSVTVINDIKITDSTIIGANSLVVKNIDKSGTYYGNPVIYRK